MLKRPLFSSPRSAVETSKPEAPAPHKAYVIVLGNEKGGSGKTTTCMHLIISLLRLGFTVGSIDIDSRQRSLSRYLENRRQTMLKEGVTLPQPQHIVIQRSPFNIVQEAEEDERERFTKALQRVGAANDFVVVDSPGSDTFLARVAHAHADTIITPINDSFVDLDVLANVDGQTMKIIKPSIYSEMVWEQKLQRAKRDGGSMEWIVMRNRLSNIDAKNKRFMTQVTTELSRRIGFRVAPGFSERVIFREMFLQGLTVLDIMETSGNASLSLSHVAARQEVRDLLKTLQIPLINERLQKVKIDASDSKGIKTAAKTAAKDEAKAKAKADSEEKAAAKAAEAKKADNYDTVPLEVARHVPDASTMSEQNEDIKTKEVSAPVAPIAQQKQSAEAALKQATEKLMSTGTLPEKAKTALGATPIPTASVSAATSTTAIKLGGMSKSDSDKAAYVAKKPEIKRENTAVSKPAQQHAVDNEPAVKTAFATTSTITSGSEVDASKITVEKPAVEKAASPISIPSLGFGKSTTITASASPSLLSKQTVASTPNIDSASRPVPAMSSVSLSAPKPAETQSPEVAKEEAPEAATDKKLEDAL